jgi:hypothetical protein
MVPGRNSVAIVSYIEGGLSAIDSTDFYYKVIDLHVVDDGVHDEIPKDMLRMGLTPVNHAHVSDHTDDCCVPTRYAFDLFDDIH